MIWQDAKVMPQHLNDRAYNAMNSYIALEQEIGAMEQKKNNLLQKKSALLEEKKQIGISLLQNAVQENIALAGEKAASKRRKAEAEEKKQFGLKLIRETSGEGAALKVEREALECEKEASNKRMAQHEQELAESAQRKARAMHGIMYNALRDMTGNIERTNQVIERSLIDLENQKVSDLYVPLAAKKCLRMTPTVGQLIKNILEECSCYTPNLTPFKDEIDKTALATVLSAKNIIQVTLSRSNQESEAIKTAIQAVKNRNLQIAFV